jgi:hypothetical protein
MVVGAPGAYGGAYVRLLLYSKGGIAPRAPSATSWRWRSTLTSASTSATAARQALGQIWGESCVTQPYYTHPFTSVVCLLDVSLRHTTSRFRFFFFDSCGFAFDSPSTTTAAFAFGNSADSSTARHSPPRPAVSPRSC